MIASEAKHQIEEYLLDRGDWVHAAELCEIFGVEERQLRQVGRVPGLCTGFAISLPGKGFKHVACATTAEYVHFKHAMRRHGIGELRRVKELDKRRKTATQSFKNRVFEKDTGQGILLMTDNH